MRLFCAPGRRLGVLRIGVKLFQSSAKTALADCIERINESDSRQILLRLLQLFPQIASFEKVVWDQIQQVTSQLVDHASHQTPEALREAWLDDVFNDGHIMAACLEFFQATLTNSDEVLREQLAHSVLSASIFSAIIATWPWHREVVSAAASLSPPHLRSVFPSMIRLRLSTRLDAEVLEGLGANLLSSDRALRRGTLEILLVHTTTGIHLSRQQVYSACLDIDLIELLPQNERDRRQAIAKLGRVLAGLAADDFSQIERHVFDFLLAQLKTNFQPTYADVISILASMADKHSDTIWDTVWSELEKCQAANETRQTDLGYRSPRWATNTVSSSKQSATDEIDEGFRSKSLDQAGPLFDDYSNPSNGMILRTARDREAQLPDGRDRLDVLNYHAQLLRVLGAIPALAESRNRLVVPAFLETTGIGRTEKTPLYLTSRQKQQRTANYLEVLAKFTNPKASYRSDELHHAYLILLSDPDSKLQTLSMTCLLTFKSQKLLPYERNLKAFLEDKTFRDELARFGLGMDSQAIQAQDRDELIPTTIRLLFGLLMSKKARDGVQRGRRQAILAALSGCSPSELDVLIDLMQDQLESSEVRETGLAAGRQQIGFLNLLGDVLRYLGRQTVCHWPRMLDLVILLLQSSQDSLDSSGTQDPSQDEEDDPSEDLSASRNAPLRSIRSLATKRLVQFLRMPVVFDFVPYGERIFRCAIAPRLKRLAAENSQAASATLDLIAGYAASPALAPFLNDLDDRTLPSVFGCLTVPQVKPVVILRIFEMINSLLDLGASLVNGILIPHLPNLFDQLTSLVDSTRKPTDEVTLRLMETLPRLSGLVGRGMQAQRLAELLGPLLRRPARQMPSKVAVNILATLQQLYQLSPDFADPKSDFFLKSFELLSILCQNLFALPPRRALVQLLKTFQQIDPSLSSVVGTVDEINAFSSRRVEEPDFDRRLNGWSGILDSSADDVPRSPREWSLLLRNALFFLQEPEEMSIRTNAAAAMKRFIEIAQADSARLLDDNLNFILMPGLRNVLRSKQESVRNEALGVLAHAVRFTPHISELAAMRPLLGDDDETNFFSNLTHIQVHRRSRAVRRLRDSCEIHDFPEAIVNNVLLVIVGHIVKGATDVTDHHLLNEAVMTMGILARHTRWSRYCSLLLHYLRLASVTSPQQKVYIRVVAALISERHRPTDLDSSIFSSVDEAEEEDADVHDSDAEEPVDTGGSSAAAPVDVREDHSGRDVRQRLLPAMTKFLSQKDDTEKATRLPLALSTVQLAKWLSDATADPEIARTVTFVGEILRSRDQDIRDAARDVICKIAVLLGPAWLDRILTELSTALQRGPQKHVLAVTVHTILDRATAAQSDVFADLDMAVEAAVYIASEVIWGESGKDAAAEGYRTKMREVRSATTRGFDMLQLLSKLISPTKLPSIFVPIYEELRSTQHAKAMAQVDEALRRIALGLNANVMIGPHAILDLCSAFIRGDSFLNRMSRPTRGEDEAAKRFKVHMKRDNGAQADFFAINAHKLVAFGLELFSTAFRRGRLSFDDEATLSRLGMLVPSVEATLVSGNASVVLLGIKAASALCRCPTPRVEEAIPRFVSRMVNILKHESGLESELGQTSAKSLAVLIRDCPGATVNDDDLQFLFEIIKPDIEEPDRQSAVFAVLKAVLARQFMTPEVYDVMDKVLDILVTSQSTHVQELCRGALMTFLLDYPQGKMRIKQYMAFLARNVEYEHESGRVSVMAFLSAIFSKFADDLVEQYADTFFLALIGRLANDDSSKCRSIAGVLLKELFEKLHQAKRLKICHLLEDWVNQRKLNAQLAATSLSVLTLLASHPIARESITRAAVPVIVESASLFIASGEETEAKYAIAELPHQALSAMLQVLTSSPEQASNFPLEEIATHLLFPHEWVRTVAAKVVAALLPLASKLGIIGSAAQLLFDIARKICLLFQISAGSVISGNLADELVKVLFQAVKIWIVRLLSRPDVADADGIRLRQVVITIRRRSPKKYLQLST